MKYTRTIIFTALLFFICLAVSMIWYRYTITEKNIPAQVLSPYRLSGTEETRPSLVNPRVDGVVLAENYLEPNSLGISVQVEGEFRFYPLQILGWHSVVNDTIGTRDIAVLYLPEVASFAVYDRGTRTFFNASKTWQGIPVITDETKVNEVEALTGSWLRGSDKTPLVRIPASLSRFEDWQSFHSNGLVLSRYTKFDFDYAINPFIEADFKTAYLPGRLNDLDNLPLMQKVIAFGDSQKPTVLTASDIRYAGLWQGVVNGVPIVAWYNQTTDSIETFRAVDSAGNTLTFLLKNDEIQDKSTGSVWRTDGVAATRPMAPYALPRVSNVPALWGALKAVYPEVDRIYP